MAKKDETQELPATKQQAVKQVESDLEAETGKDFVQTATTPPTLAETGGAKGEVSDKSANDRIGTLEKQVAELAKRLNITLSTTPDPALVVPMEDFYITDPDGNVWIKPVRQGYKPGPLAAGWREATSSEIDDYKGKFKDKDTGHVSTH